MMLRRFFMMIVTVAIFSHGAASAAFVCFTKENAYESCRAMLTHHYVDAWKLEMYYDLVTESLLDEDNIKFIAEQAEATVACRGISSYAVYDLALAVIKKTFGGRYSPGVCAKIWGAIIHRQAQAWNTYVSLDWHMIAHEVVIILTHSYLFEVSHHYLCLAPAIFQDNSPFAEHWQMMVNNPDIASMILREHAILVFGGFNSVSVECCHPIYLNGCPLVPYREIVCFDNVRFEAMQKILYSTIVLKLRGDGYVELPSSTLSGVGCVFTHDVVTKTYSMLRNAWSERAITFSKELRDEASRCEATAELQSILCGCSGESPQSLEVLDSALADLAGKLETINL